MPQQSSLTRFFAIHLGTALIGLAALLWCPAASAQGQQSAYFQLSGPHLVHQHIDYRDRHTGPACNRAQARGEPCLGANGLIVWR